MNQDIQISKNKVYLLIKLLKELSKDAATPELAKKYKDQADIMEIILNGRLEDKINNIVVRREKNENKHIQTN